MRIQELRIDNDLKQFDIACFLNISRVIYTKIERGTRNITLEEGIKLSILYNRSIEYIIGISNDNTTRNNPSDLEQMIHNLHIDQELLKKMQRIIQEKDKKLKSEVYLKR